MSFILEGPVDWPHYKCRTGPFVVMDLVHYQLKSSLHSYLLPCGFMKQPADVRTELVAG
jgi:hypothetical protein